MNGWQFAADLITKAYWPLFALLVFLVLAKPIRGLIGRIREASGPGGWAVKADADKVSAELVQSVADAVEPQNRDGDEAEPQSEGDEPEPSGTPAALRIARELERRLEIERVATNAAVWGQQMAETMPKRPGSYWTPAFDWSDDGTVRLTYGRRVSDPDGPDIVWMAPGSGKTFGMVQAKYWKPTRDDDAEGNDSRQG